MSITGGLNVDTLYISGSSVNLSNLSLLTVTPGSVSASKAVIVDSNRDISGFRSIYGTHSTAYSPLTFSVSGGASISPQANGIADSYSYIGTTSSHNFSVMAGNGGILFLNGTTYRLGIGSPNTGSYLCNVDGTLNCSQLYINGTLFQPDSGTSTRLLSNQFALSQSGISSSLYYAFDNSLTPQTYLKHDYCGVSSYSAAGFISAQTSLRGFAIQQQYNRFAGSLDLIMFSLCSDYRSSAYRNQLSIRCHSINDSYTNWY